jgi:hypothetical protein
MSNKYLSFSPYLAGLSNVIMSYELFTSIAYITKRKIILPPKIHIDGILEFDSEVYYTDIWDVFDFETYSKYFECINFYDISEFNGKYESIKGSIPGYDPLISYTLNLDCVIDDVKVINFDSKKLCYPDYSESSIGHCDYVLTCNTEYSLDLKNFSSGRKILDLNHSEKFMHFEGNLFGHYWYNIYPGQSEKRNELKKIINKVFKYKEKYYNISNVVKEKLQKYNAIHIRRDDFLIYRDDSLEQISDSEKILKVLDILFDKKYPLYIATDEKNLDFFNEIKNKYEIYFFNDFNLLNLSKLEIAVVEQIICSQSEKFYGTKYSTFTKRINVMRGCEKRQYNDSIFLNDLDLCNKNNINLYNKFPWQRSENNKWEWSDSSYLQWKIEEGELLKNYKFY